jgi:hypothetical protein
VAPLSGREAINLRGRTRADWRLVIAFGVLMSIHGHRRLLPR